MWQHFVFCMSARCHHSYKKNQQSLELSSDVVIKQDCSSSSSCSCTCVTGRSGTHGHVIGKWRWLCNPEDENSSRNQTDRVSFVTVFFQKMLSSCWRYILITTPIRTPGRLELQHWMGLQKHWYQVDTTVKQSMTTYIYCLICRHLHIWSMPCIVCRTETA